MSKNTKIILVTLAAFLVLVWGFKEKEDDGGGYSDETTYFSEEELEARQQAIAQMAEMRGETPPPTASPKPAKEKEEDKLDERFAHIEMELTKGSYNVRAMGYDPEQQILLAEFNLTGMLYAFYDVPQEEYDKLLAAADFDKWFDVMIMKKFDFEQLN